MNTQALRLEQLLCQAAHQCMERETEDLLAIADENHPISQKTDGRIRRMIYREALLPLRSVQRLKIAAAVVLILGVVGLVTCMSIPTVRASFWEAVTTFFDDHLGIRIETADEKEYPKTIEDKKTPLLPSGWRVQTISETWAGVQMELCGGNGERVQYRQEICEESGYSIYIDNDPVLTEQISLNPAVTAYLYTYADGKMILLWESDYFFYLVSADTDRHTLISIAQGIVMQ